MLTTFFSGAISTDKGEMRIWFVAHLQRLIEICHLDCWETVKSKLQTLWWVEGIHRELCKSVWDEVVALNSVYTVK